MDKKIISIVYDSKYGGNKEMAEEAFATLNSFDDIETHIIHVSEANKNWKILSESHGILFGCPTYLGSASTEFKKFMESSSVFFSSQKWKDKVAAGFTCSGAASGDKMGTLFQIFTFTCQHGMSWVSMGLGNAGTMQDENNPENLNRIGSWIGAMAQTKSNQEDGKKVGQADLKTVGHLANRLREQVIQLNA